MAGGSLPPALLFAHGGGWTVGSLDSHDALCRALCNGSGAVVVAVDYRLAPEHPVPAALDDCHAVLEWLHDNAASLGADFQRLAVAGESAGANLVTVLCRRVRDAGGPAVRLQALAYPALDAAMDTESYRELGADYGLTREAMELSWRLYTGGHDPADPDVSPLRAPDLGGLPRAYVLTCEYDPLRDEGEHYAQRLREAGVGVRLVRYRGMAHGFLRWRGAVDAAQSAMKELSDAVRVSLEDTDA